MGLIPSLYSFSASTTIQSSQVNSNFTNIRDTFNTYGVKTDTSTTITVTHTYSASQTFSVGWTAGAACTISSGDLGLTTGNLTLFAGNLTLTAGNLMFAAASAKIIPGATSLLLRNNADSASNVAITDAGVVTIRAGLTVTSGTTAVQALTATSLSLGAGPLLKISGGSLLVRDSGDTQTMAAFSGTNTVTLTGENSQTVTLASNNVTVLSPNGETVLGTNGALASSSQTTGFPRIPSIPGTPSGAATNGCFGYETSTSKLWIRIGGAWKSVTLT